MNEVLVQGLTLTVMGMGLVFLALTALWLIMWALERAFRSKEPQPAAEVPAAAESRNPGEAEVAAIVGALFQIGLLPGTQVAIGGKSLGQALGQPGAWHLARRLSFSPRRTRR